MNKITNYIRTEWKYWVAALVVAISMGHVASLEAHPTVQQKAGDFVISYDEEQSMWYVSYKKLTYPIGDTYDAIKVHWVGTYKGSSFILISGQQGRMCEMAFRLYYIDDKGLIREDRDFSTCYASSVSASFVKNNLVIKLDGKVYPIVLW